MPGCSESPWIFRRPRLIALLAIRVTAQKKGAGELPPAPFVFVYERVR